MKTSYKDFLLSGAFISLLLAGACGSVVLILPLSKGLFGSYHVVADFLLFLLFYGLLSALVLRLLLRVRPMQPGEYSMDSSVFTYWKLLTVVYRLGQGALLPFTSVFSKPLVETLFGAKIGSDVALGGTIDDPYMVSVGDGAILGFGSLVSGNVINNGKLTIGQVNIGRSALVGVHSVVLPGTDLGDNATLLNGSYALPGSKIPAGETWRGNPARKWL